MSDSATLWAGACQASLSYAISWSLLKFMSTELLRLSNHLILCHPLLLLTLWKSRSLSSVWLFVNHGILLVRILEWVAFPFSRGSSLPGDWIQVSPHCRWILYQLNHKGSPRILEWVAYPFSNRSSWPGIKPGSPALQAGSLPTELSGKPFLPCNTFQIYLSV